MIRETCAALPAGPASPRDRGGWFGVGAGPIPVRSTFGDTMDNIASILRAYGADLSPEGHIVTPAGRTTAATVSLRRGRMVVGTAGSRLYSGSPESIGAFVEAFWFWRKLAA